VRFARTNCLFSAEDFGDAAEAKASLLGDIANGQASLLRLLEPFSTSYACLRPFPLGALLGALELSLSAAYIGAGFFPGVFRHGRSLCQGEGTHADA